MGILGNGKIIFINFILGENILEKLILNVVVLKNDVYIEINVIIDLVIIIMEDVFDYYNMMF